MKNPIKTTMVNSIYKSVKRTPSGRTVFRNGNVVAYKTFTSVDYEKSKPTLLGEEVVSVRLEGSFNSYPKIEKATYSQALDHVVIPDVSAEGSLEDLKLIGLGRITMNLFTSTMRVQ